MVLGRVGMGGGVAAGGQGVGASVSASVSATASASPSAERRRGLAEEAAGLWTEAVEVGNDLWRMTKRCWRLSSWVWSKVKDKLLSKTAGESGGWTLLMLLRQTGPVGEAEAGSGWALRCQLWTAACLGVLWTGQALGRWVLPRLLVWLGSLAVVGSAGAVVLRPSTALGGLWGGGLADERVRRKLLLLAAGALGLQLGLALRGFPSLRTLPALHFPALAGTAGFLLAGRGEVGERGAWQVAVGLPGLGLSVGLWAVGPWEGAESAGILFSSAAFAAVAAASQQLLLGAAALKDRHDWALASQALWLAASPAADLLLHALLPHPPPQADQHSETLLHQAL